MAPIRSAWLGVTPQQIDSEKLRKLLAELNSIVPVPNYHFIKYEGEPVDITKLVACLAEFDKWPFEEQVQLSEWLTPLNAIDAALMHMISRNSGLLLVDPVERKLKIKETPSRAIKCANTLASISTVSEEVTQSIRILLRFLANLLGNSISKSVFNSVDEVADLLGAADDEIVYLALKVLASLSKPPALHKQQNPEGQQLSTTALHSSQNDVHRRLIMMARGWGSRGTGLGLLTCASTDNSELGQGLLPKQAGEVVFQYVPRQPRRDMMETDSEEELEANPDGDLVTIKVTVAEMLGGSKRRRTEEQSDRQPIHPRSTADLFFHCLEKIGGRKKVSRDRLFSLLVDIRLARSFYSRETRVGAVEWRLLALTAALNSNPSTDIISGYFQAQPEMTVELTDLLRPTVSSAAVASGTRAKKSSTDLRSLQILADPPKVPFHVRSLAVEALTSLVGRRDGVHGSLTGVARQSNVLSELGIGKGVYHGILPTLIRYTVASLNSFMQPTVASEPSTVPMKENEDDDDAIALSLGFAFLEATRGPWMEAKDVFERSLEFTDSLLTLTSAVVLAPTGTATLVDSGLVPSLLETVALESKFSISQGLGLGLTNENVAFVKAQLRFISAQAIQILEGAVVTYHQALLAFHDLDGVGVVASRLLGEINDIGTEQPNLIASRRVLMFSCVNCLSVVFHQDTSGAITTSGADHIRKPEMTAALIHIFENVDALGGVLVMLASTLLSDVINNDPHVVHYVHDSGIAKAFFAMLRKDKKSNESRIPPVPELIMAIPNVLSAFSLTADGAKQVKEENPFPVLLQVCHLPGYAMPNSNCMLNELATMIGTSLDELMRHVPSLRHLVTTAIVDGLKSVSKIGRKLVKKELLSRIERDKELEKERTCLMQYALNFGHLLEQVLQNQEHCVPFLNVGGVEAIMGIYPCLMPSKYEFLANVSALTCPTISTMYHTTTEACLRNAMRMLILHVEPKKVLEKLVNAINKTLEEVESDCIALRTSRGPGGETDSTIGGILDCIPDVPLHEIDRSTESELAIKVSTFLRSVLHLQLQVHTLTSVIKHACQRSQDGGTGWSRTEREWKKEISSPKFQTMVESVFSFYELALLESCNYRSGDTYEESFRKRFNPSASKGMRYLLRIVCQDGAVVRDGVEIDTCANVGAMEMGEVVLAFDRCVNSSGVMRYRTERGWVSELTRGHSREAISEVIDFWKESSDDPLSAYPYANKESRRIEYGVSTLRHVGCSVLAKQQNSSHDMFVSLSRVVSQGARAIPVRSMSFKDGTIDHHVQVLCRMLRTNLTRALKLPSRTDTKKSEKGVAMYLSCIINHLNHCLFEERRERRFANIALLLQFFPKEAGLTDMEMLHSVLLGAIKTVFDHILSDMAKSRERTKVNKDEALPLQLVSRESAATLPPVISLLLRLISSDIVKWSPLCSIFERMDSKDLIKLLFENDNDVNRPEFSSEEFAKSMQMEVAKTVFSCWKDPRFETFPSHVLYPLTKLANEVLTTLGERLKPTEKKDGNNGNREALGPFSGWVQMQRLRQREQNNETFEPSEAVVSSLTEMGFSRDHALDAIERSESNQLEVAMEFALAHPPPSPRTASRRQAEREARRAQRSEVEQNTQEQENRTSEGTNNGEEDSKEKEENAEDSVGDKMDSEKMDGIVSEIKSSLNSWVQTMLDVFMRIISSSPQITHQSENEAVVTVATTAVIRLCHNYSERVDPTLLQLVSKLQESAGELGEASSQIVRQHKFASLCHAATLCMRAYPDKRRLVLQGNLVASLLAQIETALKLSPNDSASWLAPCLLLLDTMAQPSDGLASTRREETRDSELNLVLDEYAAHSKKQRDSMKKVFETIRKMDDRGQSPAAKTEDSSKNDVEGGPKNDVGDGGKLSDDDVDSPKDPFSQVAILYPLMPQMSQRKCAEVCLSILRNEAILSPGVVHAVIILLTQVCRSRSVAAHCLQGGIVDLVLSLQHNSRFADRTNQVASLFRRLLEDAATLQSSMETSIRSLLMKHQRAPSGTGSKTRAPLSVFMSSMVPLISRDPVVFMMAAAVTVRVTKESGEGLVSLLSSEDRVRNQKSILALEAMKESDSSKIQNTKKKVSTPKSPAKRNSASWRKLKRSRSLTSRAIDLNGSVTNQMISQILSKILSISCGGIGDNGDFCESKCFLWTADLIEILTELVLAAPTCAAAIHRFRSRSKPNPLSQMSHALIGGDPPPKTFVSFLLHELLPQDRYSLRHELGSFDFRFDNGDENRKEAKKRVFITSKVVQSTSRLLLSLVARMGEGRRRVISDLMFALNGGSTEGQRGNETRHSVGGRSKVRHHCALQAWGDLCIGLAAPRSNNGFNESNTALSYEVVKLMLESGVANSLLAGLARVDLEFHMAAPTCTSLLIPLEVFSRKNVSDTLRRMEEKDETSRAKKLGSAKTPTQVQRSETQFADDAMLEDAFSTAVSQFESVDDNGENDQEMLETSSGEEDDDDDDDDDDEDADSEEDDDDMEDEDEEGSMLSNEEQSIIDEDVDEREAVWSQENDFLDHEDLEAQEMAEMGDGRPSRMGDAEMEDGWTRIEGGAIVGNLMLGSGPGNTIRRGQRGFVEAAEEMLGTLFRTGDVPAETLAEIQDSLGIRIRRGGPQDFREGGLFGAHPDQTRNGDPGRNARANERLGTLPQVDQRAPHDTGYHSLGSGRTSDISPLEYIFGGPTVSVGTNYDVMHRRRHDEINYAVQNGSEIRLFPDGPAAATTARVRASSHPLLWGINLPPLNSLVSDLRSHNERGTQRLPNNNNNRRGFSEVSNSAREVFMMYTSTGNVVDRRGPRNASRPLRGSALNTWGADQVVAPTSSIGSAFATLFLQEIPQTQDSPPTNTSGDTNPPESNTGTREVPPSESRDEEDQPVAGGMAGDEAQETVSGTAAEQNSDGEGVASTLVSGLRLSPGNDGMSTETTNALDSTASMSEADGNQDNGEVAPEQGSPTRETTDAQVGAPSISEDVVSEARDTAADEGTHMEALETGEGADPASQALEASEGSPNENGLVCPPGMDADIFNSLPADMQREVVNQHRVTSEVTAQLDPSSGLDPDVLAALPEDMRQEAIAQDRREREEASRSARAADPSNAEEMDNASFLVSLAPELREEILLTADDAFLNSLPASIIAEAQVLRERASMRHRHQRAPEEPAQTNNAEQEGNASATTASTTTRRRRARQVTGKVKVDRDNSRVFFSKGDTAVNLFKESDLVVILRLFFLLMPVRPQRLLQKLLVNLSRDPRLRHGLLGFFTRLLNNDPAGATSFITDSSDLSSDFPPSSLIGSTQDAQFEFSDMNLHHSFRSRLGAMSEAIAVNIPRSSKGTLSDGEVPIVVSARIVDTLGFMSTASSRICIDLMISEDSSDDTSFDLMLDLLKRSRFTKSGSALEQFMQMLESVVSPLASLPQPGDEAIDVSKDDFEAAASSGKEYLQIPRIIVSRERLQLVCATLKADSCRDGAFSKVNNIFKRLSKIESNRICIVNELAAVAQALGDEAIHELRSLRVRMEDAIATTSPADSDFPNEHRNNKPKKLSPNASSSVTLSNTSSELKLLRVLTTLQSLCSDNNGDEVSKREISYVTQEMVDIMQQIKLDELWEQLSGCLKSVKSLEGIENPEEIDDKDGDDDEENDGETSGHQKKLKNSAAGLLTRFLPSIEAFFVVNASTTRPLDSSEDLNQESNENPKIMRTAGATSLIGGTQVTEFISSNRILLNALVRNSPTLLDKGLRAMVQVEHFRGFLDFDVKRQWFKSQIRRLRHQANRRHGSLRLSIRRKHVFEDTYHQLRLRNADEMRGRIHITFTNEEGVDAGGLSREFFAILAKEMFNPNYALFTATEDGCTFQPNPNSSINPDHLSYLRFVGRIVGKAVSDGFLLDAHFTRSLYKHMLGLQPTHHDMEAIDPDYYKNLKMILEYPLADIGLELTFSTEDHSFGRSRIIDLIPGGRKVAVTDETKARYVQLVCQHRMTNSISGQIKAYLDGFYEMVSRDLIAIFTPRELELLISGLPDIDVLDLKANTDYNGWKATDPQIQWFWNVLMSLSRSQKAAFLQFVTGSSKVPLAGFSELQGMRGVQKFSIHKAGGSKGALMSAHTCFNSLDLPEYKTEEELKEKLLYAINEGQGAFLFA